MHTQSRTALPIEKGRDPVAVYLQLVNPGVALPGLGGGLAELEPHTAGQWAQCTMHRGLAFDDLRCRRVTKRTVCGKCHSGIACSVPLCRSAEAL